MKLNLKEFDFGKFVEDVQNEIQMISATIKEKGSNRFFRPIVICVTFIFGAYNFVYLPPVSKIKQLQRRIDAARATAQFSDSYKDLNGQLDAAFGKLPTVKERERWLADTLLETLKAEGLISDSIVPPEEATSHGLAEQRVQVVLTAKFSETYALVRHIEALKPAMHIANIDITKGDRLEMNQVNVTVGTMIPIARKSAQ